VAPEVRVFFADLNFGDDQNLTGERSLFGFGN
jgi:hypothetical protein